MTGAGSKHVYAAAYIRRGSTFLAHLRSNPDQIDSGKYGPPGGKVEPGELLEEALTRELLEETTMVLVSCRLLAITEDGRGVCFLYRVEAVGEPSPEPGQEHDWEWLPMDTDKPLQNGLASHLGKPNNVRRVSR